MALYENRMSSPPSPPCSIEKAEAMEQAEDEELAEELAASRFKYLQATTGAADSRAAAPGGRRRECGAQPSSRRRNFLRAVLARERTGRAQVATTATEIIFQQKSKP